MISARVQQACQQDHHRHLGEPEGDHARTEGGRRVEDSVLLLFCCKKAKVLSVAVPHRDCRERCRDISADLIFVQKVVSG